MTHHTSAMEKHQILEQSRTFNPRHARVRQTLFAKSDFFDPRDLMQLKYETLRALQKDGYSIARAATEFGLSRPTIYQAQSQFQQQGLTGLLPSKRGPRQPHKLTPELLHALRDWRESEPQLSAKELVRRLRRRFRIKLHPRTIEKAMKGGIKKGHRRTL